MDEFWLYMMAKAIEKTADDYSPQQIATIMTASLGLSKARVHLFFAHDERSSNFKGSTSESQGRIAQAENARCRADTHGRGRKRSIPRYADKYLEDEDFTKALIVRSKANLVQACAD